MKATDYEIINHGPEHEQYFQGCGVAFTDFDIVSTGIGDNAKEAYEDAVEMLYQDDIDSDSLDKLLPKRPRGIRKRDKVPHNAEGHWYYVSIRIKTD
jgi:hypothetical protein